MDAKILLSSALAAYLYVISPGPAFLALFTLAASKGRKQGAKFLCGHLVGDVTWGALAVAAIIGADQLGATLFQVLGFGCGCYLVFLGWRAVTTRKESIAPSNLSAERLLADLMLVYAPEDELRAAISGGKLVTVGDRVRRIFRDGRELIEVTRPAGDPWSGEATLTNFAFDYALDIQSRRLSQ